MAKVRVVVTRDAEAQTLHFFLKKNRRLAVRMRNGALLGPPCTYMGDLDVTEKPEIVYDTETEFRPDFIQQLQELSLAMKKNRGGLQYATALLPTYKH